MLRPGCVPYAMTLSSGLVFWRQHEADGVRSMKDIEGYDQEDIESVGKALLSARAPRLTIKLLLHAMRVVSAPSSAVPSSSDILMTPVRDVSSGVRPASSCSSGLGSINMPEGHLATCSSGEGQGSSRANERSLEGVASTGHD